MDRRDISTETILFVLLKRSVIFLRFLNLVLRLARSRPVYLRIMIFRLARLHVAVVRFERFRARLNRKKNHSEIKSLLGTESRRI